MMHALDLLMSPLAERLMWTLIHFLWQGLLVALLLAAIVELLRIRRPNARYSCALAALALMAACPFVTFAVLTAEGSIPSISAPLESVPNASEANAVLIPRFNGTLQASVLIGWLAGVVLLATRLLFAFVQTHRLKQKLLPLPLALADRVQDLGRQLRLDALPLVFLSRRVSEALVVGLLRPVVLLPATWATEMPLEMLEAVIAHELAHIRRHDLWINLAQRLVETLLFYHPAVWWLSRRLRQEREMCCDELAVAATGRRVTYVTTLELVARSRLVGVRPALAAGIRGEKNMRLLERVRNVLGVSAGPDRARLWPVGILAVALPLGLWAASFGLPDSGVSVALAQEEREGDKPRPEAERKEVGVERKETERKETERKEGDREVEKSFGKDAPREGDRRDGDVRKDPVRRDGEVRKEGDRRDGEVRKDPVRRDAAVRKEGEREGIRKEVVDRGQNDGRIDELSAVISKLTAEVRLLRAEVAELRGSTKVELKLKDENVFGDEQRNALERKLRANAEREQAEARAKQQHEEARKREEQITQESRERLERKGLLPPKQ